MDRWRSRALVSVSDKAAQNNGWMLSEEKSTSRVGMCLMKNRGDNRPAGDLGGKPLAGKQGEK